MKVSAFSFLRDAERLGYPFEASIRSALPLVDEFVIAVGRGRDDTAGRVRAIGDPKIRVIETTWNDRLRNDGCVKGFVYGQQKSIAHFNCTGDWALYLEGDEVIHEDDYDPLRATMERFLDEPRVEAMYFDFLHFYGNANTLAVTPKWYRREVRLLRNTITQWGPKGLFFLVPDSYRRWRYPRAVCSGARIFHYGWIRSQEQMSAKEAQNRCRWPLLRDTDRIAAIDPRSLKRFTGTHPLVMRDRVVDGADLFRPDPNHRTTRREKKHLALMKLERWTGLDVSKRHFTAIDGKPDSDGTPGMPERLPLLARIRSRRILHSTGVVGRAIAEAPDESSQGTKS